MKRKDNTEVNKMKRSVNKRCAALVVAVAMVLTLLVNPVMVVSSEPVAMSDGGEVFDLSTLQPLQGTHWNFDENVTYFDNNPSGGPPNGNVTIPTLFVNDGASLTITGTSGVEQNTRVVVNGTAHITLDNASIIRTGDAIRISEGTSPATYVSVSPLMLEPGANLTLTLVGDNTLAMAAGSQNRWSAGLGVPHQTAIVIEGEGSLMAEGGLNAAGIGGHEGTHLSPKISGEITINSGTINAIGRGSAAGIGGGSLLQTGRITINGGDITAIGGNGGNQGGAGIGSGSGATGVTNENVITINGGTVTAIGGPAAAGIGGGENSSAGTININGGTVTATGGSSRLWGGAGIGGGFGGHGGNINITGGIITATGGGNTEGTSGGGAGIGGGALGNSGNTDITGGIISAVGGPNAENITGLPIEDGQVIIGDGAYVTDIAPPSTGLVWINDDGQPQNATVIYGSINQNLYVSVNTAISLTPSFQWYTNTTGGNLVGNPVADATSSTFALPSGLGIGTHYFFAEISFNGVQGAYVRSQAAQIVVLPSIDIFYGDVNDDGVINAADVTMLRRYIMATDKDNFIAENSNFNIRNADVNGDDEINFTDVTLLRQYIAATDPSTVPLGP